MAAAESQPDREHSTTPDNIATQVVAETGSRSTSLLQTQLESKLATLPQGIESCNKKEGHLAVTVESDSELRSKATPETNLSVSTTPVTKDTTKNTEVL